MTLPPLLHPRRRLLRYADGELSAAARRAVERHLARCADCRKRLERLRTLLFQLRAWPVESPPPPLPQRWPEAGGVTLSVAWRWALPLGAAALLLASAWAFFGRERLTLMPASGSPAPFERLALAAHEERRAGEPTLELRSRQAAAIRAWLQELGYSAALVERHGERAARYELLGARRTAGAAARGAAVHALIDGRPATLLVGRAEEVTDLPAWSLLGKQLRVRRDPESGVTLISWKNAGKAYTLVTDRALAPRLACQLCHADERRLKALERAAGEL